MTNKEMQDALNKVSWQLHVWASSLPTVKDEKRGSWIPTGECDETYAELYRCSNCGRKSYVFKEEPDLPNYAATYYCQHCGYKNEVENDD